MDIFDRNYILGVHVVIKGTIRTTSDLAMLHNINIKNKLKSETWYNKTKADSSCWIVHDSSLDNAAL